ncbi:MAG: hypothetical protein IJM95_04905 [Anaerotignum sp.]|nr:hypothetical protein [Anaerotignum sp.]
MTDEYKNKLEKSLDNAAMSARMEGYTFSPQMRTQCMDVLTGRKSLADCIAEINMKYSNVQE